MGTDRFTDDVSAQVKGSANKGFLYVGIGLSILAIIITALTTRDLQNPGSQWLFVIIACIILLLVSFLHANYKLPNWVYVVTCFAWFALIGVGLVANENRKEGIPKTELITTNGHIPDAEAYIDFHEDAGDVYLDDETKEHIRKTNTLPEWVVIKGYTADAVGWVKAHPNADPSKKAQVLKTRKVL